jgi:hypothetical protein
MVTTVPIGSVRCAQVPGGAASYHVAPPLWLRLAGAVPDPEPEYPAPDFGAGLVVGVVDLAAVLIVVVVRRGTVVDGVVLAVVCTRATTVVDDVIGTVVGASVGTGVAGPPVAWGAGWASRVDTATSLARRCGGEDEGGADACIRARAGAPAMAAHSATGTARRAFLDPRVVRTPPLLQNAGAARPPPQITLKRSQRRLGKLRSNLREASCG